MIAPPLALLRRRSAPHSRAVLAALSRFWARVEKTPTCWLWSGTGHHNGYARTNFLRRPVLVHRLSWELHFGQIPAASEHHGTACVLHRCDVRLCVNPAHLFLGSIADNVADMIRKGRRVRVTGEKHHAAKFTKQQVDEIRASSEPTAVVAARFGVWKTTIADIRRGKTWVA